MGDEIIKIKRGTFKPDKPDIEKPGMGQIKCIICARYFINKNVLAIHKKTKKHKKMLRGVTRKQYTQEEADRCGGVGREELPKKKKGTQILNRFKRQSNVQLITVDQ